MAYWSVRVQRSSIMKSGTESDIARLPPAKGRNKTRSECDRINSDGRELKRRQTRKNPPPVLIELTQEEIEEARPHQPVLQRSRSQPNLAHQLIQQSKSTRKTNKKR